MEAALRYDLAKDYVYDSTVYRTLVLDKQVRKQGLAILEITTNPDSILYYSVSYGESELAGIIAGDSSWLDLMLAFNDREGELSRIKQGDLQLPEYNLQLRSNRSLRRQFKGKRGWERFYARHPGSNGLYRISAPLIRDDMAILYLSHTRGGLSGSGVILLLEKKPQWEVIHLVELWVS